MKYLSNFSIMSAMANVKRVCFVLFGAAMLYVTPSLLCSCSGSSKGNAGNGDNGNNATEQQAAEADNNQNGNTKEDVIAELQRISYTIQPKYNTKEIKTYVNKDGFMDVKWIFNSGDFNLFPFALEISRYVYYEGKQITYNPKFTTEYLYSFVLNEVVSILTKKSLQGDPMVRNRNQEIDISQYLYYLVFRNEDANDFVKERVKMHYDVAFDQMPNELQYVQEVANNSASKFTYIYESSIYNDKFKIEFSFDDNGYLVVYSSIWL